MCREVKLHLTLINTRHRKLLKEPQSELQTQQGLWKGTSPTRTALSGSAEAAPGRSSDDVQGRPAAVDHWVRPRRPGGRQARQPFDARLLLAQHSDLDFGEHELDEMHLSQRHLLPGKYYTILDVINI